MFLYVKYVAVEGTVKLRNRTEITLIFPDSRSEWRRSSCRGLRRRRSFSDLENHRRRQDHEQSPDLLFVDNQLFLLYLRKHLLHLMCIIVICTNQISIQGMVVNIYY